MRRPEQHRVEFLATIDDRATIEMRARALGMSVGAYLRYLARRDAQEALRGELTPPATSRRAGRA